MLPQKAWDESMFRWMTAASLLLTSGAEARVIRTSECIVTIGNFCPVETVGGAVFIIGVLFFAGFPIRYAMRKHFERKYLKDPGYRPDGPTIFLYRNAGKITLFTAIGLIAIIISGNS